MHDPYIEKLRKVDGRVEMIFYQNSLDNDAEVDVNWKNENKSSWQYDNRKKILSAGLKPKYRYATMDGLTYLANDDGKDTFGNEGAYLLAEDAPIKPDFPLWSDTVCNSDGSFDGSLENYYPEYSLSYDNTSRWMNQVLLIGEEKWEQYPVEYEIIISLDKTDTDYNPAQEQFGIYENGVFLKPVQKQGIMARLFGRNKEEPETDTGYADDIVLDDFKKVNSYEKILPDENDPWTISFCVNHADDKSAKLVYQQILFDKMYFVKKVILKIKRWSACGTTSKIMAFSNDKKVVFESNDIKSISVLEEVSDNTSSLSYGISSNACTVVVSNQNNLFFHNKDFMNKNRIVKPYVFCGEGDGRVKAQLGRFYSDEWEISSTSSYVKCKAYDILYGLQGITIDYPLVLEKGLYTVEHDVSPATIFRKIFELVNGQKYSNKIFDGNIIPDIDPELEDCPDDEKIKYVLLGSDSAWNMLNEVANFSQSFVFVDRSGKIKIVKDKFGKNLQAPKVAIEPSNSFSYNLPSIDKMCVNRVKAVYSKFDDGNPEDNKFAIKKEDVIFDENSKKYYAVLDLKNLYLEIKDIDKFANSQFMSPNGKYDFSIVSYNKILVFIPQTDYDSNNEFYMRVNSNGPNFILLKNDYVLDDKVSQINNGLAEFEVKTSLIAGKEQAEKTVSKIMDAYSKGRGYVEATWTGTPKLEIGDCFIGTSIKEQASYIYETCSNEFILENGLRMRTKAREVIQELGEL